MLPLMRERYFELTQPHSYIKKGGPAALSGNPCNWVPYGRTVHRTILPTFLVFANATRFRFLRKATKGVAFGIHSLLKKAGENFIRPFARNYTEKPPCGKTPTRRL